MYAVHFNMKSFAFMQVRQNVGEKKHVIQHAPSNSISRIYILKRNKMCIFLSIIMNPPLVEYRLISLYHILNKTTYQKKTKKKTQRYKYLPLKLPSLYDCCNIDIKKYHFQTYKQIPFNHFLFLQLPKISFSIHFIHPFTQSLQAQKKKNESNQNQKPKIKNQKA